MRRVAVALATTAALLAGGCASSTSAVGVVTAFDGDLQSVRSFTIRTTDGRDLTFVPDLEDGGVTFPLPHLQEHLATGERILVRWDELDDGTLVARAISDD